jgi:hypothetical protein
MKEADIIRSAPGIAGKDLIGFRAQGQKRVFGVSGTSTIILVTAVEFLIPLIDLP